MILAFLGVFVVYLLMNKTQEHLTKGPPTLLTLQTDTQDIDKRLTELKTDFDKMKTQASSQADSAAAARAQISATKYK